MLWSRSVLRLGFRLHAPAPSPPPSCFSPPPASAARTRPPVRHVLAGAPVGELPQAKEKNRRPRGFLLSVPLRRILPHSPESVYRVIVTSVRTRRSTGAVRLVPRARAARRRVRVSLSEENHAFGKPRRRLLGGAVTITTTRDVYAAVVKGSRCSSRPLRLVSTSGVRPCNRPLNPARHHSMSLALFLASATFLSGSPIGLKGLRSTGRDDSKGGDWCGTR